MRKIGYAPGFKKPTPYLREMFDKLKLPKSAVILDIAAGNGRNSRFIIDKGYDNVYCFDRIENPNGQMVFHINEWKAPEDFGDLPNVNLFLIQYLFCFLSKTKRKKIITQMNKYSDKGALAIVEVQDTKSAGKIDIEEIIPLFGKSWEVLHQRKKRCILRKIR